ncbi:hypothetical protein, variant 1 [Aphanomyces invadans]|nr:hypothetical protein, variant 1 [Aphanomyces invadans]ETV92196.1 hypothetical protein, variant 1 [Aphanomyces invadans]|eukprot:XP_008879160.1 hypothetical protein, variant 1 [Aphanomyces invadans]
MPQLKCLQRLKKTGANVESLCRNDDGVVIGVLNREINKEAEDRLLAKQLQLQEAARSARKLSTTVGDPLLELDLLLQRLPTTKSAIDHCAQFMVKQKHSFDDVWTRVVDAMVGFEQGKGRLNVVFLAHDVIRKVRGGTNDDQGNAALSSSGLIRAGERIFHKLLDALDSKCRHSTVVKEILALWTKWDVRFDGDGMTLLSDPLVADDSIASITPLQLIAPPALTHSTSTASSNGSPQSSADGSTMNSSTPADVLAVMRRHHITPGAWEIYLSRANPDELFEIDHVLTLNGNYSTFLPPKALDNMGEVLGGHNRRYTGDTFLHRYVKKNFKHLIDTHQSSVEPEQMRTSAEVLKEALVCSWEFDAEATRSIYKSDNAFIDECWRKLEARMPCDNLNAYVMSYLKRCNHNLYATNADFVALSSLLADPATATTSNTSSTVGSSASRQSADNPHNRSPSTRPDTDAPSPAAVDDSVDKKILAGIVKVWGSQLSTDAASKLRDLPPAIVRRLAKIAVAACVDGKPPHMSRLIVQEAKQHAQGKGKGKWWSPRMRATIQDAYRRLTGGKRLADDDDVNPRPPQRPKESTSPSTDPPPSQLTDDELAALKARIPKPPTLKFHKVKRKDIQRIETNINGTLGMAISGIPNSGRGMFNLSDHAWPAFSVVCIFGSRRISEDMHHDGLNKVARCGELGETFVVVNGEVKEVDKFKEQYGHRLIEYDGLVDAEGSMGGFPNDRVYEYPEEYYWDASGFYNNTILCPGCIVDPSKPESKIVLDQLYLVTWKPVEPMHEFFLAYGTSYYEEDDPNQPRKAPIKR